MANDFIHIQGARVHNLKNITLDIPHNRLIVITGLSGSGKSSLAFDTLFAEGQRRYVESLSAYARQFLGRIAKPEVDNISGISPAIAIEQKVVSRNPRSTVGTSTEIYDYLRLLFARIGRTYSPVSGLEVKKDNNEDVAKFITSQNEDARVIIIAPIIVEQGAFIERLMMLVKDGYERIFVDGQTLYIEEVIQKDAKYEQIDVVIDRLTNDGSDDTQSRIADSLSSAFSLADGSCKIVLSQKGDSKMKEYNFSNRFEADGITFIEPTEYLFSFNNPFGACPMCEGYGNIVGIDEDLVVPDKTKTVFDDGIACWKGDSMKWWKEQVIDSVSKSGFPIHRPYHKLTEKELAQLWGGTRYFRGIDTFFAALEKEKYKIQFRVLISRYTGKRRCPECGGSRLRKEASYVKVDGYTITDFTRTPIAVLLDTISKIVLNERDSFIADRILKEIKNRIECLVNVGLGYLTLERGCSTLSGGESQRMNLSTSLGSSLVGSMYILDEPSIGLHPRDTHLLIEVLKQLRDIGNTVIVVEHDEEIMRAADQIIDIGPLAGVSGGEVVFQGSFNELKKAKRSLTADYLLGKKKIDVSKKPRVSKNHLLIKGARENNLKNIDVKIPLGVLCCITGVSGSGKSSLVKGVLYPALHRHFTGASLKNINFDEIAGDIKALRGVEFIDQNPIGRSSRSNPVTYIKAYDEIRKLFSEQPYAKIQGFTPSHFSFNIAGGRCDECEGEGVIRVEMQFMADIEMECEACKGRRFKDDILEVKYRDRSIDEILDMSIDEAVVFFGKESSLLERKIVEKLKTLQKVGLGYVALGQSSSTLSGGESQRVKLASFLIKENRMEPILFIFDEPTTGLHFHDIKKLLESINALIDRGHSVVIIEHNMEVIKSADYIIDIGKEGGEYGGQIIFEGTPSELANCKEGYTGKFLSKNLLI